MLSRIRKLTRRHDTEASITRNDSCKSLLDLTTQDHIDEKSVPGTDSEVMQDKATQVNESMLEAEDAQRSQASFPLQRLPSKIAQHILGMLDVASLVCLRITCQRLRQITSVQKRDLNRCVRWKINCLLEQDLRAKGGPLPQKLACAFCKRTHHRKLFGLPRTDVGYGIECLGMIKSRPETRHCWLHMPKRFCYSPTFRDSQQERWARSLERDRWIATAEMTCLHCGTRLEKNVQSGKEKCPACTRECDVCGYIKLPVLSRFGPERQFKSSKHLRLVKRKKTGYMLEMEDRNSIRDSPKGVKYSRHSIVEFDITKNASRRPDED